MNRAYSILEIKSLDDDKRIVTGMATTPVVDRQEDVVESKGAQYQLPMPFLWHHDSRQPVGEVTKTKVTKDGIEVEVHLKRTNEPGLVKDRLDAAWQDIKLGLVRGLSIGFKGIETAHIKESGGTRFLKWLWLELSAVTIAANQEASIIAIKQIDTDLLAASGQKQAGDDVKKPAGFSAPRSTKVVKAEEAKQMKKTIAEQLSAFEATRQSKSARMDEIMDGAADKGETLDASGKEEYDTLETEVKEIDDHIRRLRAREKSAKEAAAAVLGADLSQASQSREGVTRVHVMSPKLDKGIGYTRLFAARYLAKHSPDYIGMRPDEIAHVRGWGEDIQMVLKAPVAPGTTTGTTWMHPLVVQQNLTSEFIELLTARSIIPRIPGINRVPFNVQIPRETTGLTAGWVGEASQKPLTSGALDTVSLTFNKLAAICVLTQELLKFSTPSAEAMVRDRLVKAITYQMDRDFLDPTKTAVTGVSPASITSGAPTVAATGTTADAFRTDFANLLARYTMANYSLDTLVLIMTQTQALRLSLMRNDFGVKDFPNVAKDGGNVEGIPVVASENIVATGGSPADGAIIVAANASDILLADDGGVEIDVSTEASVQMNTAPDSPETASTILASFWQRNLVGIRAERFITWAKARSDSVAYITGANYKG